MNFIEIAKALEELKTISSTNEKIKWLKSHDNKDFKKLLSWYFDITKPSGIAAKKMEKSVLTYVTSDGLNEVIDYLTVHNTGKDEDISYVKSVITGLNLTDEQSEIFTKLICKDYPMGIAIGIVNKVFPGLVPTFDVALCSKFQDCQKVIDGNTDYELTIKIDGARCIAFKENGNVKLVSRQGKLWEGLTEVEDAIKALPYDNIVLDGELTITDFLKYPSDEVYKASMKIISSKNEHKSGITLNVFDALTIQEWNTECKTILSRRREFLKKLFENNTSKAIYLVPVLYSGKDPDKISEYMKSYVEPNNYEGLVIKLNDSLYEHKRAKNWLKVKSMETWDMTITGWFEGKNNFQGTLGGFDCEVTLPDGKRVKASVGSGYSQEERTRLWQRRNSMIGKNIEVQGFELTTREGQEGYSIRFPVFKGFIPEGKELNGDYKA